MATKDLLLEIGTEELPAAFVMPALQQLEGSLSAALRDARLDAGVLTTHGTPRRLAVIVQSVADRQPDLHQEVTGPPVRAAYDSEGKPTKAAIGFAKGQGVELDALYSVETPKGEYLAAKVSETGRPSVDILPEILATVVAGLGFKKSMRWGDVEASFARPVHWICALYGAKTLSFEFGDVKSGSRTRGHRFLAPKELTLRSAGTYVAKLEAAKVLVDVAARRAQVASSVAEAARAVDPAWRIRADDALLDEVTQLVEWPVPVVGRFDADFLDLPAEVLVSEMRHHQRYFSVEQGDGRLAPAFVAVSNTPVADPVVSQHGYERVLAARLADARYFFDTDRKQRLEERVGSLGRVVFQRQLGSLEEKVDRVAALAVSLATGLGREELEPAVTRTARLAKADLVTGMVGEFPDLQGIMGRYYATLDGEPAEVARGIEEHYLPRHAGDRLPADDIGALVGIADRLDTLIGIFGIGKPPTGAADPFGLRRATLAVVSLVLDRGYRLDLAAAITEAAEAYGEKLAVGVEELREQVLEFFRGRLRHLWVESHPVDVVEAVLSAGFSDLVSAHQRVAALSDLKSLPEFESLAVAFSRTANIVAKAPVIDAKEIDAELFEDEAERDLWKQGMSIREKVEQAYAAHDYRGAFQEMVSLREPVDSFFEKVLVMAEDARVRDNRLLLLSGIAALFDRVADFSQIQTESN